MKYRVELTALFRSLEQEISSFSRNWQAQGAAKVYCIAPYVQGRVPDGVEVDSINGADALALVDTALSEFRLRENQSPGSVIRLPGVARCEDSLLPRLVDINARKDQLREAIVQAAPKYRARNTLMRRLFPGRNMLQVYRHIHVAEPEVTRIAYSWSPVTSATTTLSHEQVRELITARLESATHMEPDDARAHEIALDTLGALTSGSKVIQRRPVAPHPRITLFNGRGRGASKKMHHANLPVFVAHDQRIDLGTLSPYDPSARRHTRSDAKNLIPLLYPLHLYMTQ